MIRKSVLSLVFALTAVQLHALIIVRHDRDPGEFVVQDKDFPALFNLFLTPRGYRECVATLIAPTWALTAAHCAQGVNRRGSGLPHVVTIGGNENSIEAIHVPEPMIDLALLKLGRPVTYVEPVPLFKGEDGVGQVVVVVGWGDSGTGLTGPTGNDKALRKAENRITEVDGTHMMFRFDDPESGDALPLEGISGPGDSGGPAFIRDELGQLSIAGISHSQIGGGPGRRGRYGVTEVYARVQPLREWLLKMMADKSR